MMNIFLTYHILVILLETTRFFFFSSYDLFNSIDHYWAMLYQELTQSLYQHTSTFPSNIVIFGTYHLRHNEEQKHPIILSSTVANHYGVSRNIRNKRRK